VTDCRVSFQLKTVGVAKGGKGSHNPEFLTYLVVLCFERRSPALNYRTAVARLQSKIVGPSPNFELAASLLKMLLLSNSLLCQIFAFLRLFGEKHYETFISKLSQVISKKWKM